MFGIGASPSPALTILDSIRSKNVTNNLEKVFQKIIQMITENGQKWVLVSYNRMFQGSNMVSRSELGPFSIVGIKAHESYKSLLLPHGIRDEESVLNKWICNEFVKYLENSNLANPDYNHISRKLSNQTFSNQTHHLPQEVMTLASNPVKYFPEKNSW